MRKNLYVDIWTRLVPYIMQALQQSMLEESAMAMQLNPDAFNAAGNRKSYSFSLTFVNGFSRINEGSAVSRDLRMTLLGNVKFKEFSANKTITLQLICKHIIYLIISDIQYLLMIFARHLHNEDGNCF